MWPIRWTRGQPWKSMVVFLYLTVWNVKEVLCCTTACVKKSTYSGPYFFCGDCTSQADCMDECLCREYEFTLLMDTEGKQTDIIETLDGANVDKCKRYCIAREETEPCVGFTQLEPTKCDLLFSNSPNYLHLVDNTPSSGGKHLYRLVGPCIVSTTVLMPTPSSSPTIFSMVSSYSLSTSFSSDTSLLTSSILNSSETLASSHPSSGLPGLTQQSTLFASTSTSSTEAILFTSTSTLAASSTDAMLLSSTIDVPLYTTETRALHLTSIQPILASISTTSAISSTLSPNSTPLPQTSTAVSPTSTTVSTTSAIVDQSNCTCPCDQPLSPYANMTEEERAVAIQLMVEKIEAELTLDTSILTSTIRKKISASDKRESSTVIGFSLGVTILTVIFGSIVLTDVPRLYRAIRLGPT